MESQTGVKLTILGNGAGRGLEDLAGGKAEIAMIGGPLQTLSDIINKEKPGTIKIADLKEFPMSQVKIAIITHPGVGVKSLSENQLRDIFSGKITQWKAVGGADIPVKVVLPFAGDGVRATIQQEVMKDVDFTKTAIIRNTAKDISVVIAQLPGSCSCLSVKNVEGNVATIKTEKEYLMPLSLVTKGEPSGDIKKVIEAAKEIAK